MDELLMDAPRLGALWHYDWSIHGLFALRLFAMVDGQCYIYSLQRTITMVFACIDEWFAFTLNCILFGVFAILTTVLVFGVFTISSNAPIRWRPNTVSFHLSLAYSYSILCISALMSGQLALIFIELGFAAWFPCPETQWTIYLPTRLDSSGGINIGRYTTNMTDISIIPPHVKFDIDIQQWLDSNHKVCIELCNTTPFSKPYYGFSWENKSSNFQGISFGKKSWEKLP